MEDLFKFTVYKDHVMGTKLQPFAYPEEVAGACEKTVMDIDALGHALFEGLVLQDCTQHIINTNKNVDLRVIMNDECINYLFEWFKDLILDQKNGNNDYEAVERIMIRSIVCEAASALKRPDLYKSDTQDIHTQVINVFSKNNITHHNILVQFFRLVAAEIREGNSFDSVCRSIEPILYILKKQIQTGSIQDLPLTSLDTMDALAKIPEFALVKMKPAAMVKNNFLPNDEPEDELYNMSILGMLFSMPLKLLNSSLALKKNWGDLEFMGQQFWPSLKVLSERLHRILLSFLDASPITVSFEPSFIDNLANFHRVACCWLVQLLLDPNQSMSCEQNSFAPLRHRNLNIELPSPPDILKRVAEFLFENLHSFLMLLSQRHPIALERLDFDFLKPVLTALIIYMGSNRLEQNPYVSIHWVLAKCMCLLLTPTRGDFHKMDMEHSHMNFSDRTNKLLNTHPYRHKIIPSLLEAFYGVKTNCGCTGSIPHKIPLLDGFGYYHRMYKIMGHLWTLEDQKQVFKQLVVEAEQNMEAVNPPLFLRFINILLNDATFLLQNTLSEIEGLKWANFEEELDSNEKMELLVDLDNAKQSAKLTNMLWMDTITMLENLTEKFKSIFCHNSVVNQVSGVLNDHLIHLVGPRKKKFRIKNIDEYKFDTATIVRRICAIYINLGCNGMFRAAVGRDGCASQLLRQATDFLMEPKSVKLGMEDLNTYKFSRRVRKLAKQIEGTLGILMSEAPDDFLDAITSTLMIDPVIIMSSGQVVDSWTIEKRLSLSENQAAPCNRLPLFIGTVKSDVKLKQKIEEWILKNQASSST